MFASCENTKVSHKKSGQSKTPHAHEERCYNPLWGTEGSVTDHWAYFSDAISLQSPAVKLVERLCYALKQTLPIYANKYQINTQYHDIVF